MKRSWVPWNRQQKRVYHRVLSCTAYWLGHDFEIINFMLTTEHEAGVPALDVDIARLTPDFERLRRMICRRFGYDENRFEFLKVITREGGGVIHGFMAYKPRDGERRGKFFIPQRWLSAAWKRIHGASYVWINAFYGGQRGCRDWARYLAGQYLADQYIDGKLALVRISYSWSRTFGFPLVKVWREFRRWCPVAGWSVLCAGGEVEGRGGGKWSIESIKAGLDVFRENERKRRGVRVRVVDKKIKTPYELAVSKAYAWVGDGGTWREAARLEGLVV